MKPVTVNVICATDLESRCGRNADTIIRNQSSKHWSVSVTDHGVAKQLRDANTEQAAHVARLSALKSTVLDRSLDLETRLRALLEIDSIIWRRRRATTENVSDDCVDKITRARRDHDARRLERERQARIAAGLSVRGPRKHLKARTPTTGAMVCTEPSDSIDVRPPCMRCGSPIIGRRKGALYCSTSCQNRAAEERSRHREREKDRAADAGLHG
jgi:hypothetical protein